MATSKSTKSYHFKQNLIMQNIPFSPPDMTEAEASMVSEVLGSGWITTGPKTNHGVGGAGLGVDYHRAED